jgi:hypothetical protein
MKQSDYMFVSFIGISNNWDEIIEVYVSSKHGRDMLTRLTST